jgi:hypothetical protein
MKLDNLVGNRYGRLIVVRRAENSPHGSTRWLCKCDCGNECVVHSVSLKTGNTTSCGCFKRENAQKLYSTVRQKDKHLYSVWSGMKQRCFNKNSSSYHNYGGRGITMDSRWAENYETFYNWAIKAGYKRGLTIDRINNDGNYCEENCRFVDRQVQANNKRNVKTYTIDGKTQSLPDWCREYNIGYSLVYQRVSTLRWPIDKALSTPK